MDNNDREFLEVMGEIEKCLEIRKDLSKKAIELYQYRTNGYLQCNRTLTKYEVVFENPIFWASRESYFKIIKSFIEKEIGAKKFDSEFLKLRSENMAQINLLVQKINKGSKTIPDFSFTTKSFDFVSVIGDIFFDLDLFDPSLDDSESSSYGYSEGKLRSVVTARMQKYFDDHNSSEIS